MKQTVQLQRVETRGLVLDVIQPLTKETLTAIANGHAQGIGVPTSEAQISHSVGAWRVLRVEPSCECAGPIAKSSKKKGK